MRIVQKMIVSLFVVILVNCISYIFSEEGSTGGTDECCQDKPKLSPNDKLVLGFFYEQYEDGNEEVGDLYKNVCKLMETCGKQISMVKIPGALVKEENCEISCPEDFCLGDQQQVCVTLLDSEHKIPCEIGVTLEEVEECVETRTDEVNGILSDNGKNREKLGIPEYKIPALTFNGIYDSCAKIDSYDDLLNYVCDLYENQLNCCHK